MYAIIESGNKQYKVEKDDVIDVELLEGKTKDEVKFDNVLFLSEKDKIEVGTPHVKGAHVTAKVLGPVQDDKVTTFKYHNKVNYHRTIGHRQRYLRVQITDIKA